MIEESNKAPGDKLLVVSGNDPKYTNPDFFFSDGLHTSIMATRTAEFDGCVFELGYLGSAGDVYLMMCLDLAYRARHGDAVAKQLLDQFKVVIVDRDRRCYWPPEQSPDAPS